MPRLLLSLTKEASVTDDDEDDDKDDDEDTRGISIFDGITFSMFPPRDLLSPSLIHFFSIFLLSLNQKDEDALHDLP